MFEVDFIGRVDYIFLNFYRIRFIKKLCVWGNIDEKIR